MVATEPEQLYMHPNNNAWECAERIKRQQQQRHTHTLQSGQKLFKRMRENQNAFMQTNKKKTQQQHRTIQPTVWHGDDNDGG